MRDESLIFLSKYNTIKLKCQGLYAKIREIGGTSHGEVYTRYLPKKYLCN